VMGIAVSYAAHALGMPTSSAGRLAMLLALVTFGVVLYGTALHVSGVAKLKDLVAGARG